MSIHLPTKTYKFQNRKVHLSSHQIHLAAHKKECVGGSIEFMCDRGDCGKTFRFILGLQIHLEIHDNHLKKCYFCPWTAPFSEKRQHKVHLNQHISKPDFKCSMCDKAFFRKQNLDEHMEINHEKNFDKYKCGKCGWKTYTRNYYFQHMKHECPFKNK